MIGLMVSALVAGLCGHLLTFIMDPGTIRILTSFLIGGIIGIVGMRLSDIW